VGPKGRIIAFEPDPQNASILAANVASAGKENVIEIVRAAVGAKDGTTLFQTGHDYCSRISAEESFQGLQVVVQCALNGFDLPQGTVIKVDVEGAEADVLQGATNHLKGRRTTWIIEVHGADLERVVLTTLCRYGYHPKVYAPVHPVYADYSQRYILAIGI